MWLMLTMLFRRSRDGTGEDGRHVRVTRLRQTLTLAIVVLAVAVPTPATAQVDTIIGTTVTVENTFTSANGTTVGGAGPIAIDESVEFADCCSNIVTFDIDLDLDRITMTWVGDADLARVIEAGTIDEYTFTFADANFKRAFADQSQLLAPEVTWTDDSITLTIAEGDEVGPGRDIVVIVTPFAPNLDGVTAGDAAAIDESGGDAGSDAEAVNGSTPARLPRTGSSDTAWLAVVAIALLGLGLITSGTSLRSRSS